MLGWANSAVSFIMQLCIAMLVLLVASLVLYFCTAIVCTAFYNAKLTYYRKFRKQLKDFEANGV